VSLQVVGEMVELAIYDDGPGIPEDDARQLFSQFYQMVQAGGRSVRGLGLGPGVVHRPRDRFWA